MTKRHQNQDKPEEILEKVKSITPLSQSMTRLMTLMAEPHHGAQDVTKIVQLDEVLTAAVLRVVNSTAYGLRQPITAIDRAVGYLGDRVVFGIATGSCASQIYSDSLIGYEGERGMLWRHSLCTAIAAKEIAALTKMNTGVAYTLGIVHDIGKTVISEFLAKSKPQLIQQLNAEDKPDFLRTEQKTIGTDHCEVGAALCSHWNLPNLTRDVIRYHHSPSAAPTEHQALTYVIHMSDVIAMMVGEGTGIDALKYDLDPAYKNYISLSEDDLDKLLLRVDAEFQLTKEMYFEPK